MTKILNRVFLVSTTLSLVLNSDIYYAKTLPIETFLIKSNVSGKVLDVNYEAEGKVSESNIVTIDSENEQRELRTIESKISFLEDSIKFTRLSYDNLEEVLKKKRDNFEKILKLTTKSQAEKDREFYDLASTENQYYSLRDSAINKRIQINDLKKRIEDVKKSIKDKIILGEGLFIEKIFVKSGEFVTMGTPILTGHDLSKAKLILYLSREDFENINQKSIYIDDKKSDYNFSKIWNITDEKYISSYRAEIEIDAPKVFSKLLKIELK